VTGQRVISAVLLAAGESRRMGSVNKLVLDIGGVPLLRRTAMVLLGSRLREIVVVLGHQPSVARALLEGLPLRAVENPHYREGQMTSVQCGLQALQAPCDGVMVCLSDLPLLETEDVDRLVEAFLDGCPRSVLVPTHQGRRGNPIVLAYAHRATILAGDRNLGCKRLIEKNPELVWPLEMANDHCTFDLDSPEDYDRLQARVRANGAPPTRSPALQEEPNHG
jgi:molybdenum cofactor cytidylyltransferase